jgi:hypothetical protein
MSKTCNLLPPVNWAVGAFDKTGTSKFPNMQTYTLAQFDTTIEVLTRLHERLTVQAMHFIAQLPDTPLGAHYAGNMGMKTIEQTECIDTIIKQLKNWHDELAEQDANDLKQPDGKSGFHDVYDKSLMLEKEYLHLTGCALDGDGIRVAV